MTAQPVITFGSVSNSPSVGVSPPLTPGEVLDAIFVSYGTDGGAAESIHNLFIEAYVCNSPPASVAAARAGQSILGAGQGAAVPGITVTCQTAESAGTPAYSHFLQLRIPFARTIRIGEQYVAIVLTNSSAARAGVAVALLDMWRGRPDPSSL